jgi:hypothetical protein
MWRYSNALIRQANDAESLMMILFGFGEGLHDCHGKFAERAMKARGARLQLSIPKGGGRAGGSGLRIACASARLVYDQRKSDQQMAAAVTEAEGAATAPNAGRIGSSGSLVVYAPPPPRAAFPPFRHASIMAAIKIKCRAELILVCQVRRAASARQTAPSAPTIVHEEYLVHGVQHLPPAGRHAS